jgi:methylmalonyl-CoA mutase C-terminal domain/subunit
MRQERTASTQAPPGRIRVMLAKVGLDGHDRGVKIVARALRDAGMEVIYTGMWQTPEAVVRSAVQEDVGFIGLSFLTGSHTALLPKLFEELRAADAADIDVIIGGIIPQDEYGPLEKLGVARVFGPGSALSDIVAFIQDRWARKTSQR